MMNLVTLCLFAVDFTEMVWYNWSNGKKLKLRLERRSK